MTGHGDMTFTSRAVDAGAFDCLQKPFQGEFVALAIKRALEAYTLRRYRMDMHLFLKELATCTTELESLALVTAREIDQATTTLEGAHLEKVKGSIAISDRPQNDSVRVNYPPSIFPCA